MCARYGIGFWEPGSGIIHQVVLENYAFPGGMMIGTDSHTPNAGGLGMIAIGVGGGDAIDVMTGSPFNVRWPRLIGVHLTGSLSGWSSAKDVILRVADLLTTSGGTGAIVEYFGPGADTISATGQGHDLQHGSRARGDHLDLSLRRQHRLLSARHIPSRASRRRRCHGRRSPLRPGGRRRIPDRFFDHVIEIDLSELRPLDQRTRHPRPRSRGRGGRSLGPPAPRPDDDLGRTGGLVHQLLLRGHRPRRSPRPAGQRPEGSGPGRRLLVTPGSEQIRATIERDGLLGDLEAIGATVLANACGPCIGQWDRQGVDPDVENTIVTSYNRNFSKRNDGSAKTKAFVASPEMVIAYALAGTLDFNPLSDAIDGSRRYPCSP